MATKKIKLITDKGYYLGINKNNENVYLEKPSWDCDWYWGFGYLEHYTRVGRPVLVEHRHWDSFVREANTYAKAAIEENFKTLTITGDKLWKLCDYMFSFYKLREAADLFTCGNSHQTNTNLDLSDKEMAEKINKVILPKLFAKIDELFVDCEKQN